MDKNGPLLPLILKSSSASTTPGARKWVIVVDGVPSFGITTTNLVPWIALWILRISVMKGLPCSQLASTCHVEHHTSTWVKKSGWSIQSMTRWQITWMWNPSMLIKCSWTKVNLLSKPSRLSKLSHVIILVLSLIHIFPWCFLGEFHAWCVWGKCRGIS